MSSNLLIAGTTIESLVPGGPGYNSQRLEDGDEILAVDGEVLFLLSRIVRPFLMMAIEHRANSAEIDNRGPEKSLG